MPQEAAAVKMLSTPADWTEGAYQYAVGVEIEDVDELGNKTWRPLDVWLKSQDIRRPGEDGKPAIALEGYLASEVDKNFRLRYDMYTLSRADQAFRGTSYKTKIDGNLASMQWTGRQSQEQDRWIAFRNETQIDSTEAACWTFAAARINDEIYTHISPEVASSLSTIKVEFRRSRFQRVSGHYHPVGSWSHGTYSHKLKGELGTVTKLGQSRQVKRPASVTEKQPDDIVQPHCSITFICMPIEKLRALGKVTDADLEPNGAINATDQGGVDSSDDSDSESEVEVIEGVQTAGSAAPAVEAIDVDGDPSSDEDKSTLRRMEALRKELRSLKKKVGSSHKRKKNDDGSSNKKPKTEAKSGFTAEGSRRLGGKKAARQTKNKKNTGSEEAIDLTNE